MTTPGDRNAQQPLLVGKNVTKYFGGLAAVHRVDFVIYPGEIVGLVGPNGSGKTTLFNCLSRLIPINSGEVFFKGKNITHAKPYQVAHMGLSRTFQVIRVYRRMTVLENMLVSRQWRGEGFFKMLRPSHPDVEKRAHELLRLPSAGPSNLRTSRASVGRPAPSIGNRHGPHA